MGGSIRCVVAPQLVDEAIGGDDPIEIYEQQRKDRTLLRRSWLEDRTGVVTYLERAKD